MAERRMFAKTIVLSDAFLDMPLSARCLYFTLGMLADDDGFVNAPKSIMRQCGASNDDMNVLLAKRYILAFDSGVIVIRHWRIHNYIKGDRYNATKCTDEMSTLQIGGNKEYEIAEEPKALSGTEMRKQAYKESELPYSFEYKIRAAFRDKPCPICGMPMKDYQNAPHRPSIQHNVPISKGGKHELSNISVICHSCNLSIQDNETSSLNNAEVVEVWNQIMGIHNTVEPQVSVDKESIEQVRLVECKKPTKKKFTPPTLQEIEEYAKSRESTVDCKRFYDYYNSGDWKDGQGKPVKNWKQKLITWEQHDSKPVKPGMKAATASTDQSTINDLDKLLERVQK